MHKCGDVFTFVDQGKRYGVALYDADGSLWMVAAPVMHGQLGAWREKTMPESLATRIKYPERIREPLVRSAVLAKVAEVTRRV